MLKGSGNMDKHKKWLNENSLQKLVEEISLTYFNRPFQHRALYNNRLRTTGGRYLLHSHHIEINPKQVIHFGYEGLVGIIKHELCHYHLHIEGEGYKHQDREFKSLMKKVGAPRYCDMIPGMKREHKATHVYRCLGCSLEYVRKRRIDTSKFVCGKCRGKLQKKS
ncbi:SprT family protein [Alkalihalobacillus hemicellulosilyticus]|uniref:Protein SprT-like n=1 Tax=Halalkalibacter hemicellulosilyticusJCM 9152 TaxID=1236971 RepID=W4QB82_9BACI|nr:SprT family protein [Halalkalibacter hemicellulosilyticus]GAE28908.1 metallopeptidase [Halalkalibacter hemicellulosilyticusJCM 9152]